MSPLRHEAFMWTAGIGAQTPRGRGGLALTGSARRVWQVLPAGRVRGRVAMP
jgi:hypothetical protein